MTRHDRRPRDADPRRRPPRPEPDRGRGRAGVRVRGGGPRAGRPDAQRHRADRHPHPDPARHAQPARPGRRRDRHRQDQDPAADGRAAERQRRPGLRGRHQGRPLGHERARRGRREDRVARRVGGADLDRDGVPRRVLRARRPGHRRPDAGDHDGVRAGPAVEGARPQRHPGVQPRPGLPLRRPQGPAAARPVRPARGRVVADQRRGQARPQGARRPLGRDGRRDPARADRLPGPGRRRVLRRDGVRVLGVPPDHRRTDAGW